MPLAQLREMAPIAQETSSEMDFFSLDCHQASHHRQQQWQRLRWGKVHLQTLPLEQRDRMLRLQGLRSYRASTSAASLVLLGNRM
mmetsp:Transcript_46694/g.111055  ORF Transcript_46694/g.111055 Transcript_46694/m.111055 type:complete len:85 (-) Transcript_46694:188-442(-)